MDNLELNCRLQKSDFLQVGTRDNLNLTSISIINSRTGETQSVCLDAEQVQNLVDHLNLDM